jgi:hypothetical protein
MSWAWLSWMVSLWSILGLAFAASRWAKYAWLWCLVGQGWWVLYIITAEQWGLLPGTIAFTLVYGWNVYKTWRKTNGSTPVYSDTNG